MPMLAALLASLSLVPQATASAGAATPPPIAVAQSTPSATVAAPRGAALLRSTIRVASNSLFAKPRVATPAQRRGTPNSAATFLAPAGAAVPAGAASAFASLLAGAGGSSLSSAAGPLHFGPGGSRLPAVVLQALERGPISEREADVLVELLLSSDLSSALGASDGRLLDDLPDPDLSQVAELLDGAPVDLASAPLDAARLREWFERLDISKDQAVSFLEWRDVTAAPLALFRSLDEERDGLVRFDEFARAILVNTAREGRRAVDPELLAWARASLDETSATVTPLDPAELESLTDAQVLARARAEIAAAAALQAAATAATVPAAKKAGG